MNKKHDRKKLPLGFKHAGLLLIAGLTMLPHPALAQNVSADFSSGSVIIGYDNRSCGAGLAGTLRFNSANGKLETCTGSGWMAPVTATNGYLVQTSITFNGTMYSASTSTDYGNGLTGADAACLANLTAANWLHKSDAGTLTSARVKALLCDSTTCNQPNPNTVYMTAVAGDTSKGGIGFLTDSQGRGPGNSLYFDVDNYETSLGFWSNRGTVDTENWSNSPATTNHCSDWSSTSGNGRAGNMSNNNASRWNELNYSCNTARYLMCMVHP